MRCRHLGKPPAYGIAAGGRAGGLRGPGGPGTGRAGIRRLEGMATSRHVTRAPSATDWIAPWMQMCEIAYTPPLVIGYRTARMLTGGWPPSARDRREYTRMWQEKVEAFTQAAMAAATAAPGPVAAGRALTPVHRRVRGNARRLSRR